MNAVTCMCSSPDSDTANRHALRSLARVGGGAFEFFDRKAKSKWQGRVKGQLLKASQPSLSCIEVVWQQFNNDDGTTKPVQAPKNIMALFNGCRQVVYGFVPNCTQVHEFIFHFPLFKSRVKPMTCIIISPWLALS